MSRRHKSPTGGEPTQLETLLKKPEVKRDHEGRFERHGKTLAKTHPASPVYKRLREFIAGVIASLRTTTMKRRMDGQTW